MADTTKKVHPRMAEALANAEKAATSNRGMYPMTKASNVLDSTGEPLEARDEAEDEDLEDDDNPQNNEGDQQLGGGKEEGDDDNTSGDIPAGKVE